MCVSLKLLINEDYSRDGEVHLEGECIVDEKCEMTTLCHGFNHVLCVPRPLAHIKELYKSSLDLSE